MEYLFSDSGKITLEYKSLISQALSAMEFAYAPYSEFKVGAALIAGNSSGEKKMFYGCNIENGSYGATICAERTAMVKAVSDGYNKLKTIAIVSSKGDYTYPCGICRQFLSEFASDNTKIIFYDSHSGMVKEMMFKELIPEGFYLN